jgi:uncharacterized protein (UPF0276 family)
MMLGVNFTGPGHLELIRALAAERRIGFVEVLVDNFLSCRPDSMIEAVGGLPVAFHIMRSKFLTRPIEQLRQLAARLRPFIAHSRPLYVSDHLAVFDRLGRGLPLIAEVDYDSTYELARERTRLWQDLLGCPLHLENFPSILPGGRSQPAFLARLRADTGCGVLFDASNAMVAKLNVGLELSAWEDLARDSLHWHAAGYSSSGTVPEFVRDTHDQPVSAETAAFVASLARNPGSRKRTMSVERDGNHSLDAWRADLDRISESWTSARLS